MLLQARMGGCSLVQNVASCVNYGMEQVKAMKTELQGVAWYGRNIYRGLILLSGTCLSRVVHGACRCLILQAPPEELLRTMFSVSRCHAHGA